MNVGFIGLGTMGGSMAMNAIRGGHRLVVHDIRRESATPHLEMGAEWADTPREVAERSEVVLTSLPGPVEVEAETHEELVRLAQQAGELRWDTGEEAIISEQRVAEMLSLIAASREYQFT